MGAKSIAMALWKEPFVWKFGKSLGLFAVVILIAHEMSAADAANVADITGNVPTGS